MLDYRCRDCAYFAAPNKCALGKNVQSNDPKCSDFSTQKYFCDICHQQIHHTQVIYDAESNKVLCTGCLSRLSTCDNCHNATHCAFNDDPSPLPKQIQQRVQQGPFGGTMIVDNPERQAITCAKGCQCWDGTSCLRSTGCAHLDKIL